MFESAAGDPKITSIQLNEIAQHPNVKLDNAEKRYLIGRLAADGVPDKVIEEMTGIDKKTVATVAPRFRSNGIEYLLPQH